MRAGVGRHALLHPILLCSRRVQCHRVQSRSMRRNGVRCGVLHAMACDARHGVTADMPAEGVSTDCSTAEVAAAASSTGAGVAASATTA
jgi:hypothetical protein